jgi:RND family efflux transporter MFP subunit
VLTLGVLVAAGLVVAKPKPQAMPVVEQAAPAADVIVVSPENRSLVVKTQGSVTARREIDVVAQVSGVVTSVSGQFVDGGFFDNSHPLLTIEDHDYRFALIRAESKLASAKEILATERGRQRVSKREWRDLGNEEANALFLRKPQIASAEAAIKSAEADRDQAQMDLDRTQLVAPFKGRIWETYVDIGQYVTAGTKIARIYSTDVVEVRLPLSDRQVALLDLPLSYQGAETATPIPVTLKGVFGGKEWQWQAVITRTDASIDVKSRMVYAVAEVAMPFSREADSKRPPLSIGQFVHADISGAVQQDVVSLPRKALHPGYKVWILDQDDRLQQLSVNVLQSNVNQVMVKGNFSDQSRVVVSQLAVNVAGMKVTPVVDVEQFAGLVQGLAVN